MSDYDVIQQSILGEDVLFPSPGQYLDLVRKLFTAGFGMCIDLTAVDYLDFMDRDLPEGIQAERFELVLILLNMADRKRIRLRIQLDSENPAIASLHEVYAGSDAHEREAYDMFGITFEDHPHLSRILMPEDWQGHPLRKDFSQGRIPVQFKAADNVR